MGADIKLDGRYPFSYRRCCIRLLQREFQAFSYFHLLINYINQVANFSYISFLLLTFWNYVRDEQTKLNMNACTTLEAASATPVLALEMMFTSFQG